MPYFAVAISELDQGFLAGFLEGEASFLIFEQNGGQSYGCALSLTQRDDDQDLIEWLVAITGLGRLHRVPARATSKPQIVWRIDTQHDCVEMDRLLAHCGFHGRRAAELAIWSHAVRTWVSGHGDERRVTMRALKLRLEATRRFGCGASRAVPFADRPRLQLGYISGFVSAEGSFWCSPDRPRFSVHLRSDDSPLLKLLAETTGLGRVYDHAVRPPLNPSSSWTVRAAPELARLVELMREADLPCQKRRQMETWAIAVEELENARQTARRPRGEVLCLSASELRAVRTYRPSTRELLELPGRDLRAESLAALEAWAAASDGRLSCVDYSRWRRHHRDAPTRNTITTSFGSWYAAMEAAGLADRAARRGVRRIGGEERRRAQRVAQRARVVEAVRRFEAERGRLPRAVEFFRWRFEGAPDSPTQATVYNLFPGGWAEVLDVCRAGYGLT